MSKDHGWKQCGSELVEQQYCLKNKKETPPKTDQKVKPRKIKITGINGTISETRSLTIKPAESNRLISTIQMFTLDGYHQFLKIVHKLPKPIQYDKVKYK